MKSVLRWLAIALGFRKTDNATTSEQESRAKSLPNDVGDRQAPPVGEVLSGRYRLDQLIGRGGAAAGDGGALAAAVVQIGETQVIESHQVQHRRVDVVHVVGLVDGP